MEQDSILASVSIKIPEFMQTALNGLFAIYEAQFVMCNITSSDDKFYYVLSCLLPDIIYPNYKLQHPLQRSIQGASNLDA